MSPSAEQEAETEPELGSTVVVARADWLGKVDHPVVAAVDADRERSRDVKVDAGAEMASGRGFSAAACEDTRRADEATIARAEYRPNRCRDKGFNRLIGA